MLESLSRLNYKLSCDPELQLPAMLTVEQTFEKKHLDDPAAGVRETFARLAPSLPPLSGKRIALTAGSRGIKNIVVILRALVAVLKEAGALPFIVPAMGSHGGATAEGQLAVLADYGITEESVGAPIVSSMDTELVGRLPDGLPVYCDKAAYAADYLVPVNRVKVHADFKAPVESGLCKMLAIGLGKHQGAKTLHHLGFSAMSQTFEAAAAVTLASGHVLFGLAILENGYSQTMRVEAVPVDGLIAREKELLLETKKAMAKLLLKGMDILIVDQIGKEISGAGMDPNVTGRPVTGNPGFDAPPIQVIAALDLSDHSNGNAIGMGMADVVTLRLAEKVDFSSTYTNSITATGLIGSRLPLVARDDRDAVLIAYCASHNVTPESVRVVHIKNTSALSVIEVSENMRSEVEANPTMRILSGPKRLEFDGRRLVSGL